MHAAHAHMAQQHLHLISYTIFSRVLLLIFGSPYTGTHSNTHTHTHTHAHTTTHFF